MNINERDFDVLSKVVRYCDEIEMTHTRFSNSLEIFRDDFVYRNAVAMCVLQIGELTAHLSDSFKEEHNGVPWQAIKAMRNFVAHQYGKVDLEMLWQTSHQRIAELKRYCLDIQQN